MYKIIGADQREYGPVTADQIRQWIREGRANGATLAKPEGATEFTPLSTLPEFADALPPAAPAQPAVSVMPADLDSLAAYIKSRDYDVDIGDCFRRSWELFKQNAGLLIGATAIFLVLILVTNQIVGLLTRDSVESLMAGEVAPGPILVLSLANIPGMALTAVLSGGIYALFLRLIRGQPAGVGVIFSGFSGSFTHLALAGIVVQLLTMVGLLACIAPGIYLSIAWIFTVPLIIDRGLPFWPAMELSRKVVTQHWWQVFCLLLVVGVTAVASLLACCIGLIAGLPIGLGALMFAYEDIFGGPGAAARAKF